MPTVPRLIRAFARQSGMAETRVRNVARRLQEAEMLPISTNRREPKDTNPAEIAALIIALLVDCPLHEVAGRTREVMAYHGTSSATTAGVALAADVARMLAYARSTDGVIDVPTVEALMSSVTLVSGERPALVFRMSRFDSQPREKAFTPEGKTWTPQGAPGRQRATSIGGPAIFNALAESIGSDHVAIQY